MNRAVEERPPIDYLSECSIRLENYYNDMKERDRDKLILNYLKSWPGQIGLSILQDLKIEFGSDQQWFNTAQAFSIEDFRGKLIVLNFFSYYYPGGFNFLQELRKIELKHPPEKGLVVIGIHTSKFENSKTLANIAEALKQYHIRHPVVIDRRAAMWKKIGIFGWPTLFVISPTGLPLLMLVGASHFTFLKYFVDQAIIYYENIDNQLGLSLAQANFFDLSPTASLRFPAKIVRSENGLFALADVGNHRVLVFDSVGNVLHKVGGTTAGYIDGNFHEARFSSPHGVSFSDNDTIVVADTNNHLLREIALDKGTVITLVGTNEEGTDLTGGRIGSEQPISYPLDVAVYKISERDLNPNVSKRNTKYKRIVFIAMAGLYQIWAYFPESIVWWKSKFEALRCYAVIGTSTDETIYNSNPQEAAFSELSRITVGEICLYIADRKTLTIRKVSMVAGKVTGLLGENLIGSILFSFSNKDVHFYNVRLQRCMGFSFNEDNGKIYYADSFNHKIKVIDPSTGSVKILLLYNEDGRLHNFSEPTSVCTDATGKFLLVSDTKNHNIQYVNLHTMRTRCFNLNFSFEPLSADSNTEPSCTYLWHPLPLRTYSKLTMKITFALDVHMEFKDDEPQKWVITSLQTDLGTPHKSGHLHNGALTVIFHRNQTENIYDEETITFEFFLPLFNKNNYIFKHFGVILIDDSDTSDARTKSPARERLTIRINGDEITCE